MAAPIVKGNSTPGQSEDELRISAATFKRLHPRTYLERFLASRAREDGRSFGSWRRVSVVPSAVSSAHGSCMVRWGATTVVASVKGEIAPPSGLHAAGSSTAGWLVPNIEITPMSSSRTRPGAPSDEAQVIADRLASLLTLPSRPVLDPRALAIAQDVAAWCLYLDVSVISHDGNVANAAALAALGALRNTRLPKAIYDDRSGRVVCSPHTQDQWPLPLLCLPLSFTFGVYNGEHLLTDPSAFEEGFTAQSTITIGLASDTALGVRWAARGSASAHNQDAMQVDAPDDASNGARPTQVLLLQQAGYCRASQPASNPGTGTGTGLGGETTPSPLLSTEDVIALCLAQARTRYTELLELLQAAE